MYMGEKDEVDFDIDMIIKDKSTESVLFVMDTKDKDNENPIASDVEEIIAYTYAKQCNDAILISPIRLTNPFIENRYGIRVRWLSFCLKEDIEEAGKDFLEQLFTI
jgi:hypothetical protein